MTMKHLVSLQHLTLLLMLAAIMLPTATMFAQDGNGLPSTHKLDIDSLRHEYQGWNNCGPTTLTMGLSYFDYSYDQYIAAEVLKPNREDKNVSPWEMVAFVNENPANTTGTRALYRPGGNLDLLKTLLAADFPVIIEKGYAPEGYDWMGHYLLMIGYNDTERVFYTYDSFLGHGNLQGLRESYDYIEDFWWHFNNTFIVIYDETREDELFDLMGPEYVTLETAYTHAGQQAQRRAQQDPNDAWARFNLAESLTMLGQHDAATPFFRQAFDMRSLPWRTLWYRFTPFEAFYQTGQFTTVLELVTNNLVNTPYVEEWYYYRGLVEASRGNVEAARRAFNNALAYNARYFDAQEALAALNAGTFTGVAEVQ